MLDRSIEFLKNTKKFLDNLVNNLGYNTCHRIKGYNVDVCHEDCLKQEKSEFAQNCTRDGGFFKCCIRYKSFQLYLIVALISCFRRDKENCHECRYCCTLSICDTNKGPKFRFSDRALKKVQEKARKDKYYQSNSAAFGYSHDMRLFKHYDYRCLKPKASQK